MRVGVDAPQESDFSVKLPQKELAQNLEPLPTSPELPSCASASWASYVGWPQYRGRIFVSRVESLRGGDVLRIAVLAETF